jgi:hypothetical protein
LERGFEKNRRFGDKRLGGGKIHDEDPGGTGKAGTERSATKPDTKNLHPIIRIISNKVICLLIQVYFNIFCEIQQNFEYVLAFFFNSLISQRSFSHTS